MKQSIVEESKATMVRVESGSRGGVLFRQPQSVWRKTAREARDVHDRNGLK